MRKNGEEPWRILMNERMCETNCTYERKIIKMAYSQQICKKKKETKTKDGTGTHFMKKSRTKNFGKLSL
jgi:hypothetical protein